MRKILTGKLTPTTVRVGPFMISKPSSVGVTGPDTSRFWAVRPGPRVRLSAGPALSRKRRFPWTMVLARFLGRPSPSLLSHFSRLAAVRHRSLVAFAGMAGVPATLSASAAQIGGFLSKKPYAPPSWATHLSPMPSHTFSLGHVSFPIDPTSLPTATCFIHYFRLVQIDWSSVFKLITFLRLTD